MMHLTNKDLMDWMEKKPTSSVIFLANNVIKPLNKPIKNVSKLSVAIRSTLILAQIFGVMPVIGITSSNVNDIKFKLWSFRTIYSIVSVGSIIIYATLYLAQFLREEMDFGILVATVFYLSQATGYILFIKLARKWNTLIHVWEKIEKRMKHYEYQPKYNRRFVITTLVILLLGVGEHILSILNSIQVSSYCPQFKENPTEAYFSVCCTNVFTITSYATWKIFFVEIPIIMGTFIWNFMDIFIILISAAIAERFKQLNKRVEGNEIQNQLFWKQIREDYNGLWKLCKTTDSYINNHVTLSFASNLFFICWQMFNSLKPMPNAMNMFYFYYSFILLLARTATVSAYCCWINDESKELLSSLFGIPNEYYCVEADRLIQQISTAPAAFTGSNFFTVTRGLCLQVASAIVTFEIILMQIGPALLQTDQIRLLHCLRMNQE